MTQLAQQVVSSINERLLWASALPSSFPCTHHSEVLPSTDMKNTTSPCLVVPGVGSIPTSSPIRASFSLVVERWCREQESRVFFHQNFPNGRQSIPCVCRSFVNDEKVTTKEGQEEERISDKTCLRKLKDSDLILQNTFNLLFFFFFYFWWLGLLKRSSVYHCDHRLADFSKSSVRRPVWTRVLSRGKSVVSTKCKPGEHFLVATPRAGPETLSFSTLFLESMCATRLAPVTSRLNSQQPVCAATGRVASQWGLDWGWGRVKVPMARGLQTRILLEMALPTDPSSLQALDSVKHQHTKAVITVVLQGKKKMIFTFIC